MRALLVGEANPYGSDESFALFPAPENCAGWRLCYKVLAVSRRVYLHEYARVNLCSHRWSMLEARRRAAQLIRENDREDGVRTFVLLGSKVAEAFCHCVPDIDHGVGPFERVTKRPWISALGPPPESGQLFTFVRLPHPSGRNRAWNEPGAFERARAVLREVGALPCSHQLTVPVYLCGDVVGYECTCGDSSTGLST